jgi:hypothetical protein
MAYWKKNITKKLTSTGSTRKIGHKNYTDAGYAKAHGGKKAKRVKGFWNTTDKAGVASYHRKSSKSVPHIAKGFM